MRIGLQSLITIVAPLLCVSGTAFFAHAAFLGANGYRTLAVLNANAAIKSAEIEELSAQRRRLEVTANQLNPKSLDPDMVDEKVRSVLGFVAEGDVVVPRDQLDQMLAAARGKMSATGAR